MIICQRKLRIEKFSESGIDAISIGGIVQYADSYYFYFYR